MDSAQLLAFIPKIDKIFAFDSDDNKPVIGSV